MVFALPQWFKKLHAANINPALNAAGVIMAI
jgi:hypothetical protein